jgi:hypothetical protein
MKSLNSRAFDRSMINALLPLDEVAALIQGGAVLGIAGRPAALAALPRGQWIGGTTPYFMTDVGGVVVGEDQVFVTDFSTFPSVSVTSYDAPSLDRISADAPENGFALTILPADSECHRRFATEAADYPAAFLKPTVGWIAGYDLSDPEGFASVYLGTTGEAHRDRAVVLHVALPEDRMVQVEIVNLFTADDGDVFRFDEISSTPDTCWVGGTEIGFADYVRSRDRAAGTLPLVGDFGGGRINSSIRSIAGDVVTLYSPVYPGVDYRFAAPVADYAGDFRSALSAGGDSETLWSCNCILNFLFGDLEGKAIGGVAGPFTFGEIAYQLLNQTLVRVRTI